jgi:cyanophycin synthetase
MTMTIRKHLLKNDRFHHFVMRQANRFLIRPYVLWRGVPIIAITGTNGKTTVTRLLNKVYLSAGYRVGMACTEGVYLDGVEIVHGDYTNGPGIWRALKGNNIDIIIAETGRGGIIRSGLGYQKCQVGVVTNVHEDHLGQDGVHTVQQMAEVKSAIPRHTYPDGTVVLNGDHPLVRPMAAKTRASITYFTVEDRQKEFDRCYYSQNDYIFRKDGSFAERILAVNEIPISLQGMLKYNIANAMAALAAVEGMQALVPVPQETVRSVLREFGNDPNDNPTRLFTMLRYKGKTVLLCRLKNPASIQRDAEILQRIQKKYKFDHLIGILTGVGDRRQDHFERISRMVAPICRYFFVRPPAKKYWRGRTGEEIVHLLSVSIHKDRILSTENLPLESVFDQTQHILSDNCLYVYFNPLLEADLDVPKLISEAKIIPLEIGD